MSTLEKCVGVQVCSLEVSFLLFCSVLGASGFLGEVGGQTLSILTHQGPFGKRGGLCSERKAERELHPRGWLQWCAARLRTAAFGKELGE